MVLEKGPPNLRHPLESRGSNSNHAKLHAADFKAVAKSASLTNTWEDSRQIFQNALQIGPADMRQGSLGSSGLPQAEGR